MAKTQKNNPIHNFTSVYIGTFAPYENNKRLPIILNIDSKKIYHYSI